MSIKQKAASFAHLLGITAKKAEEDEDKKREGESDEDYAKRMEEKKEEEDAAKKAEEDDAAAKKAEEEKKKEEDAKKAEEDEDEKQKAARTSERARCRAIFSAASAGARPDMAAHMAFDTDMSAKDAIALLDVASVGAARTGLGARMAAVPLPKLGADAGASHNAGTPEGAAAQIIAAGKKRRGEA